ncbi:hypothetical protein MIND_00823500 [Mycena indigotica]|uniref:BTB domain-containing protein n=1 Tax=Mycena indigotica TaxID=2126181 RepID=A0A8H6SFQ8_9AGAR|nr:uncharacterized protein MIND_00823500 [Mycena indigotica]KAF7298760.1 hypothetical protein MIND_00823500 [Mycena indigotica]
MEVDSTTHRCEELWFEDGNIVLQAGATQYKVYRGTMARNSPVFHDMLGFPQPAEAETVEGLPLVKLHDDAEEVTPFLKALFIVDFFLPFPARTTYEVLRGCLRLGQKYAVDSIHKRALVHFSSYFVTSLESWDFAQYTTQKADENPSNIISWTKPESMGPEFYISCILLAREVEATWTLPTSFYHLSTEFKIVGTGPFRAADGKIYQLSTQDQGAFLRGSEEQMGATWDIVRELGDPEVPKQCPTSPQECTFAILNALYEANDQCRDCQRLPLQFWDYEQWQYLGHACTRCRFELKQKHNEARMNFWNDLPMIYELPSWTELEVMREAAIGDGLLI